MGYKKQGQSISEYVLIVTLVIVVGSSLFPMLKRSTQSLIKAGADQIGMQKDAEQDFDEKSGYLLGSNTVVQTTVKNPTTYGSGSVQTDFDEETNMATESHSKAGVTEL